jgi:ammonium transporter, Amt family
VWKNNCRALGLVLTPRRFILGQRQVALADVKNSLDTFFLIWAASMVFFMQTGFAMLCAGSIRAKNVKNVILWNLLDSCGGGLAYWATGYAFAYGGDDQNSGQKTFIGNQGFFLQGDGDITFHFWLFQFAFACALSSIVAGTIAERTQMKAYLLYSVFLAGFVYPVVSHAIWSANGFLSTFSIDPLWGTGVIDLAGSGPVHMAGGVTALAAVLVLGPRMGRFYEEDGVTPLATPAEFPPYSVALQFLGTFALWFGWYGFNPGSVLLVSGYSAVSALAAVNTTLAACAGAVSAMFTGSLIDYYFESGIVTYDTMYTMNGALTGLAAITSPCATVETWAAVIIGIFSGFFYLAGSKLLIRLRIDDAVDAIPVHMIGGAWGVISAGLFSKGELLQAAFGKSEHVGWCKWSCEMLGRATKMIGLQQRALFLILFSLRWQRLHLDWNSADCRVVHLRVDLYRDGPLLFAPQLLGLVPHGSPRGARWHGH